MSVTEEHFIRRLPQEIVGSDTVWKRLRVRPGLHLRKEGRRHVYSKQQVVDAAVATFGGVRQWLAKLTAVAVAQQVGCSVAEMPGDGLLTAAQFEATDPLALHSVHDFCAACNVVVDSVSSHTADTFGVCTEFEVRFRPCSHANQTLPQPTWCMYCHKAVKDRFTHGYMAHFGCSFKVTDRMVVVSRGHPGLQECRARLLENIPDVAAWAPAWATATCLRSNHLPTILAKVKTGGKTVALFGSSKGTRFLLRRELREKGVLMSSRGSQWDRHMFLWHETEVEKVLAEVLPISVVSGAIMPKLRALVEKEEAAAQAARRPHYFRRLRTCDECGCEGDRDYILRCAQFHGQYCEDCIENDDVMCGYKWEP